MTEKTVQHVARTILLAFSTVTQMSVCAALANRAYTASDKMAITIAAAVAVDVFGPKGVRAEVPSI